MLLPPSTPSPGVPDTHGVLGLETHYVGHVLANLQGPAPQNVSWKEKVHGNGEEASMGEKVRRWAGCGRHKVENRILPGPAWIYLVLSGSFPFMGVSPTPRVQRGSLGGMIEALPPSAFSLPTLS